MTDKRTHASTQTVTLEYVDGKKRTVLKPSNAPVSTADQIALMKRLGVYRQ